MHGKIKARIVVVNQRRMKATNRFFKVKVKTCRANRAFIATAEGSLKDLDREASRAVKSAEQESKAHQSMKWQSGSGVIAQIAKCET
jgi:C4-type Zn-finger protein